MIKNTISVSVFFFKEIQNSVTVIIFVQIVRYSVIVIIFIYRIWYSISICIFIDFSRLTMFVNSFGTIINSISIIIIVDVVWKSIAIRILFYFFILISRNIFFKIIIEQIVVFCSFFQKIQNSISIVIFIQIVWYSIIVIILIY